MMDSQIIFGAELRQRYGAESDRELAERSIGGTMAYFYTSGEGFRGVGETESALQAGCHFHSDRPINNSRYSS